MIALQRRANDGKWDNVWGRISTVDEMLLCQHTADRPNNFKYLWRGNSSKITIKVDNITPMEHPNPISGNRTKIAILVKVQYAKYRQFVIYI